jgi:hypothetical protein
MSLTEPVQLVGTDVVLVAVVEVDRDNRILCKAAGCGHSVYRRIHIVLDCGEFVLLGSDCYRRLYGTAIERAPVYGWGSDRKLSDDERQRLIENTASFIEQLEVEFRSSESKEQARAAIPPVRAPIIENVPALPHRQAGRSIAESQLMRVQFELRSYGDDEYCGQKVFTWRWGGTHGDVSQIASTWRHRLVPNSDHDLVLRQFHNFSRGSPYEYAMVVENACYLPKFRTLRVLHELGLTTR